MPPRRRTRSITFRLSEEEYSELKSLLEAQDAHSLSELVRTYVLGLSKLHDLSPAASRLQFWRIEQRLAELDGHLKTLMSRTALLSDDRV